MSKRKKSSRAQPLEDEANADKHSTDAEEPNRKAAGFPELPADDPIYTRGLFVGIRRNRPNTDTGERS